MSRPIPLQSLREIREQSRHTGAFLEKLLGGGGGELNAEGPHPFYIAHT